MSPEPEVIYQQRILDHYKNPSHYGELADATHRERGINPLCGDEITFFALIKEGKLQKLTFIAQACAICTAASSLLTENFVGKSTRNITPLKAEDIVALLGITLTPLRLKCATLPLHTLKNLVKN